MKPILAERNLKVNDDKTEETSVFRAETKELELWRKVKKLGSLLGDFEDMKRRTTLAVASQKSIEEMFKKSKASLEEKAKVYKSVVKHVLTYNYSTWGLSKNEQDHLDRFHRKQLRRLCPSLTLLYMASKNYAPSKGRSYMQLGFYDVLTRLLCE